MPPQEIVYLDHAGTTPTDPRVLEAMLPYFTGLYGNPSSMHTVGQEARYALDGARERVAKVLHCRTGEIVFTGSGTESDNAAINGVATALEETGRLSNLAVMGDGELLGFVSRDGIKMLAGRRNRNRV